MPYLICLNSSKAVKLPGDGPLTVGRGDDADLQVVDGEVSRHHFQVRPAPGGGRELLDLGSSNGTTLNGSRVAPGEPRALGEADCVKAGRHVFIFSSEPPLRMGATCPGCGLRVHVYDQGRRVNGFDCPGCGQRISGLGK